MAFLLPPSVKQRLLRFALSKIDVIDDSAIDLDKFNFSWGRTSVITLPKVPLKAAVRQVFRRAMRQHHANRVACRNSPPSCRSRPTSKLERPT